MKVLKVRAICLGIFLGLNFFWADSHVQAETKPVQAKESKSKSSASSYQANPKSLELNELGAQAVKKEQFKAAEDLFLKAHLADPKNLTAVFNLAGMYLNNKKIKDSIDLLEGYLKTYDQDAGLYARLGDAYFSSKDTKKAIANYERALSLEADYPRVPGKLGTLYLLSNDPKHAEAMLTKAVEQDPRDLRALSNLSSLQLALKKPGEAIKTAMRAAQIVPTSEVFVTMGAAYESLKDYKSSLGAFERARELGDTRPELQERIDTLKKAAS